MAPRLIIIGPCVLAVRRAASRYARDCHAAVLFLLSREPGAIAVEVRVALRNPPSQLHVVYLGNEAGVEPVRTALPASYAFEAPLRGMDTSRMLQWLARHRALARGL